MTTHRQHATAADCAASRDGQIAAERERAQVDRVYVFQAELCGIHPDGPNEVVGPVKRDRLAGSHELAAAAHRQGPTLTDSAQTDHHQISTHPGNARSRAAERHVAARRQLHMACGV